MPGIRWARGQPCATCSTAVPTVQLAVQRYLPSNQPRDPSTTKTNKRGLISASRISSPGLYMVGCRHSTTKKLIEASSTVKGRVRCNEFSHYGDGVKSTEARFQNSHARMSMSRQATPGLDKNQTKDVQFRGFHRFQFRHSHAILGNNKVMDWSLKLLRQQRVAWEKGPVSVVLLPLGRPGPRTFDLTSRAWCLV